MKKLGGCGRGLPTSSKTLAKMKWGIFLIIALCVITANATLPELVLSQDERKSIQVASFGFFAGGSLSLDLRDLELSNPNDPGRVAFYIRKARDTLSDEDEGRKEDEEHWRGTATEQQQQVEQPFPPCFLDNSYVREEIEDGTSIIEELAPEVKNWTRSLEVGDDEGLWQIIFINCKQRSTVSFRLTIDLINPNANHLSAGDTPLPYVYGFSSAAYLVIAFYWFHLLVYRKDTRVFRAHWLMLVLVVFIHVDKALHSAKYYHKMKGVLTEAWQIGFYIFACVKGILSILIIILLASGWMFIKPYLSVKDKRVISIIVPLQVLANIASAIGNETAVGSADQSFWAMVLPLIDLAGCAVILWTILQTRKHLGAGTAADGKESDVINKYKLWSSFYIVTLVYIYVTRIVVQLLQASLPFRYVTWVGEAVDETATLLFYVFIGYKFRPYPNNPYTQVPESEDVDVEPRVGARENEDRLRMYPVSRSRAADSNEVL
ncbi:lung seven transmembrane receptor-domain-containing protein [Dichotomocladium elegans]|nr:lung seven transmembrane receptor-domain-containing protein [Dichotomocladium elegans]